MRRSARGLVSLPLLIALAGPAAGEGAVAGRRLLVPAGAWALAESAPVFGVETPARDAPQAMGSALALASTMVDDGDLLGARGMGRRPEKPKPEQPADAEPPARPRRLGRLPHALSGERARLMMQSLTMPGWGQATLGERRAALAFGVLEAGVWGSFTAFRIQQQMRRQTYERTARLFAGIDLGARDEEYRRVVGFYLSSDDYNRLVVRRDAVNLYFGDPAAIDAYIAAHELKGDDAWAWDSEASLLRYRAERRATQRALKHAHDALAAAVINRLVSMIHASAGGARRDAARTSWKVECVPTGGVPTAFHLGLRADF
jgi:hypothetical protein